MADLEPLNPWIWMGRPPVLPNSEGVFSHLKVKPNRPILKLPSRLMTWKVFERDILPTATKLEFQTGCVRNSYVGITWSDGPNIFQWPHPGGWYVYHNGSLSGDWNLPSNSWVDIKAIVPKPCHWNHSAPQFNPGVILILEGATARRVGSGYTGGGMFPSFLRNDLRDIRSTIEAHSNATQIQGDGDCNGYLVEGDHTFKVRVNGTDEYTIDRWE